MCWLFVIIPFPLDTICLLGYNLIVAIAGAIVVGTKHDSDYLVTMGFAVAFFILFVPGSMICWYIPVYRAYRSARLSYICVELCVILQK